MQLRDYQRDAVNAIYSYFIEKGGNPLIVMPTGSGKSFVMAAFIREVIEQWPDQRLLVLTHVKELIKQNYVELVEHWTMATAGIYSAGLNRRDAGEQVIFAGIQSVHNKAEELQGFDLILIDEAHLVPRNSNTMYRRFLDDMLVINERVKIIGFTATHYRLDSGLLTKGSDRIFTDIAFEVEVKKLVEDGYLCPLVTKDPSARLNTTGVKTRGGEFVAGDLAKAVDKADINESVCKEIRTRGKERKSWLIFCTGVEHAYHVRDILRSEGIITEMVTGEINAMERDFILEDFKAGRIRAITNCDILTTGFNAPAVDLLAMVRPTKSTGLYVQMLGRGMRNAKDKENCLVLDFAGNMRLNAEKNITNALMLNQALTYASFGWAVFPVHSIQNGACTCGDPMCKRPGKHPITRNGFHNATTDPAQIQAWWTEMPWANIGISTGRPSGNLLVIDIDTKMHDGLTGEESWDDVNCGYPDTMASERCHNPR